MSRGPAEHLEGYSTYTKRFIQHHLPSLSVEFNEIASQLSFVDRTNSEMKWRGNALNRSKAFFVKTLQPTIPIYRYPGFQYASVQHYQTIESNPLVKQLHEMIYREFAVDTNHVIATLYEDENDSIGWHDDKMDTLDPNSPIYIFSFGQERELCFRKKNEKDNEKIVHIPMEEGSLLKLTVATNELYEHSIQTSKQQMGPRISLIFRSVRNMVPKGELEKKQFDSLKQKQQRAKRKTERQVKAAKKFKTEEAEVEEAEVKVEESEVKVEEENVVLEQRYESKASPKILVIPILFGVSNDVVYFETVQGEEGELKVSDFLSQYERVSA